MTYWDAILFILGIFGTPAFVALYGCIILFVAFFIFIALTFASRDIEIYDIWEPFDLWYPIVGWVVFVILAVGGLGLVVWGGSATAAWTW